MGQTEEKIYNYLESIGIKKKEAGEIKQTGLQYTKYNEIPKPDLAPLAKNFRTSFEVAIKDGSKNRDANPLRALD